MREALRQRAEKLGAGLHHFGHKAVNDLRDALQHVADHGQQVAHKVGPGRVRQCLQGCRQVCAGAPIAQHVLRRCLHGRKAAGQGRCGFSRRGAGDVHFLLDHMNSTVHIGQIAQIVVHAGKFFGIIQQTLHFSLRTTIAQLEVVQHGIVLLGKSLIGILDILHIRAHLVGVVGHIHHGHIGKLGGGIGILAHAGKQACRKAGGLLHVVVGGKTHGLVGLRCIVKNGLLGLHQGCIFVFNGIHRFAHGLGIFFHALAACTKQRFNAADALLQGTAHIKRVLDDLTDASGGKHFFDSADQLGTNALADLCA